MKTASLLLAVLVASACRARDTSSHDAVVLDRSTGVTWAQRGGLSPSNFVAVAFDPADMISHARTNSSSAVHRELALAVRSLSGPGSPRPLPPYLVCLDFDDRYEDDAEWYYSQADAAGACSARRNGGTLERNYDWKYDSACEAVVRMSASSGRFASVGVANVGTNLFGESGACVGVRWLKALPGATVDGINERGVVAEINVVPTNGAAWEARGGRDVNAIGAVRWALDFSPTAEHAATNLAKRVYVPESMKRNGYSCHFMVADASSTWIVEDGVAHCAWSAANGTDFTVMTNFRLYGDDPYGTGYERYGILTNAESNVTSAWFRAAYRRPFSRPTEFAAPGVGRRDETDRLLAWAEENVPQGAPETLKRNGRSWQTVHTSVYDFARRTLRVAVQETDDWYVFSVPASGSGRGDSGFRDALAAKVLPLWKGAANMTQRDKTAVLEAIAETLEEGR